MENLDEEESALLKKLEEVRKKKEELAKPLEITLSNIMFHGMGATIEIKLSKFDNKVIDLFRRIPTRNYIHARETNQFNINQIDRIIYELNEIDLKLNISDEYQLKITEWKESPDFILSLDQKKKQIRIDKTIRQTPLPYLYNLTTFTNHQVGNYATFSINEILLWMEYQNSVEKQYKFELSDDVVNLYKEHFEREKLIEQFSDMKDAPDINFHFEWDDNGICRKFDLKPDQRVACKFDDTFNHRTLLSFDMGKGKTAIAIAQAERHNERVLFICKADLKTNIKREVKKFTGKEAHIFSGIEPDGLAINNLLISKLQYNILNYDVVGRSVKDKDNPAMELMKWVEVINLAGFDRIIYDEAHYMRNIETQRSKGGRSLKAPKVMLLTGTPIVNRPAELFPILNIIDPVTFYDYSVFKNQFTTIDGMPKNLPTLHKLLKKYMIRRKADVSNKPNRITQYTELSQQARINYEKAMAGVYIALRNPDYQRNINNILVELMRCKQICADDKVDFTVDLAETALEETVEMPWNKVLIYSQFKNSQAEIAARLGAKAAVINGEVTDKFRYELVDKFMDMNSGLKVIITNITEGLTLTSAFTTIINDLPWTPKDIAQFEGRAFGRENDPHGGNSYSVIAEDTVEDYILTLLSKKASISEQIVDNVYSGEIDNTSVFTDLIKYLKGNG